MDGPKTGSNLGVGAFKLPGLQLMGVTLQIDRNKQSLAFPTKRLENAKVAGKELLLLVGHDGHAVTLNCGMLWAVGGSSSLLGRGPHFHSTCPLVSFTNPLAAESGLVERTPKKVLPPPIWSFSSPSFVVQRNTKLPRN